VKDKVAVVPDRSIGRDTKKKGAVLLSQLLNPETNLWKERERGKGKKNGTSPYLSNQWASNPSRKGKKEEEKLYLALDMGKKRESRTNLTFSRVAFHRGIEKMMKTALLPHPYIHSKTKRKKKRGGVTKPSYLSPKPSKEKKEKVGEGFLLFRPITQ